MNVVEDNFDTVGGDMLSIASNLEHPMDSWILDSACLFHMTSNTNWFDTCKSINYGIVSMSNGAHYKITSIGN